MALPLSSPTTTATAKSLATPTMTTGLGSSFFPTTKPPVTPPSPPAPASSAPVTTPTPPTPTPPASTNTQTLGNTATVNEATARAMLGSNFTGVTKNADGTYTLDSTALARVAPPATGTTTDPQQVQQDANKQAAADKQAQMDADAATTSQSILNLQNGATPLTTAETAQITALKSQFDQIIAVMQANNRQGVGKAQISGAQQGSLEYDPYFQARTIGAIVQAGAAKVADMQNQEAAAIAKLTQAFHDNDIQAIKDAYNIRNDAAKASQAALQKTIDDTAKAIKEAQDAKIAADKVQYDEVTKPIQDIGVKAAQLGASPETLAAIKGAQTVDDAIAAAGTSIQTSTNPDIAQYLFYKQQGGTNSYDQWQQKQNSITNQQAYAKAYATASGTAAGAAAGMPGGDIGTPLGLGGDSNGGSILGATGLSLGAFKYLSGDTGALTRLTSSQRMAIMKEAQKYALAHGVDVSTMQAQYKAQNEVVQNNIARANNTKVMAGEVAGTLDSLISVIEGDKGAFDPLASVHGGQNLRNLRAENILDLMVGKQVNNAYAQKYAFQLQTAANDLAGYFAASRSVGASGTVPTPDDADKAAAANVIANGMNKGSAQALKDSVNANEQKVQGVVNKAAADAQQSVWKLFGVGDKFVSGNSNTSDMQLQDQTQANAVAEPKLTAFYNASPTNAALIDSLMQQFPNLSAAEAAQNLGL